MPLRWEWRTTRHHWWPGLRRGSPPQSWSASVFALTIPTSGQIKIANWWREAKPKTERRSIVKIENNPAEFVMTQTLTPPMSPEPMCPVCLKFVGFPILARSIFTGLRFGGCCEATVNHPVHDHDEIGKNSSLLLVSRKKTTKSKRNLVFVIPEASEELWPHHSPPKFCKRQR